MNKRTGIELAITGILSFLLSLIALSPALQKVGSAWGGGDMLATYVNVDNWGLLGYTQNNHYGFPFGINTNLFPNIDITQNYFAKAITVITGNPFTGINILLALSFPVIAMLAYLSIRLTGLRGPLAIALATAFTMIPYHFGRGLGHTYLAVFYGAVASVILAQLIGSGRLARMLSKGNHTTKTFTFNVFAVALLIVLTALSGVYYAVFGLILMSTAWLWRLSKTKNARHMVTLAIPIVATGLLAIAGFIPALLALSRETPYASLGERVPFESVVFAGNLAMAILAAPISKLTSYNINVSEAFGAAPALENSALTNYGTWITFAALVFVGWALLTRYRKDLTFLLTLTLVTVLFFVPWGFGYLFAAIISPQIRAWNRLVPILLLLFILMATTILARMKFTNNRSTRSSASNTTITLGVTAAILVITAVESIWPFRATYSQNSLDGQEITQAAQNYTNQINTALPQDCAILQLPYMVYPENAPIRDMNDYEHFWTALVDTQKRWSYGAVKYTKASAWMAAQPEIPTPADMSLLAQAGFCGIHLDTRAYIDPARERITATLTERYGQPAASQRISNESPNDESPNADWLFWITDASAAIPDPGLPDQSRWTPELVNLLTRPAITTNTDSLAPTVAPRGSKDSLTWWWTIAPVATFDFHQLTADKPLESISGGLRIPDCLDQDSAHVTLTLGTGESVIVEANAKTTTSFELAVKDPASGGTNSTTTLTVSSDVDGCQPVDFGYSQFVQVIDLTSNP